MNGYTSGVKRQPTIFLWLACLMTLLVGSGSALPAAGVWQCQHASQLVASAPVSSNAMPCHRGSGSMPMSGMSGMACCAARQQVAAPGAHLAAPGCRPTFIPLAVVLSAITEQAHPPLLASATLGELPRGMAPLAPALLTLSERQRPPPDICWLHSSCFPAFCLRSPPSA